MNKNIKLLKEELTIGFLALLGFLAVRYGLTFVWPDTPLFDLASETETMLLAPIKLIMIIMFTYFVMRITWPQAYTYFRDAVYFNWHAQGLKFKRQFSIGVAVAIFFALTMFTSCSAHASELETRTALVSYLETQLDVREATGKNDGAAVKKYLNHVGLGEGYPWCVAFVAYNLGHFDIPNPNSAWSPHYAKKKDVIWSPKMKINGRAAPGDVFTIYSNNRHRVVHGGFVKSYTKSGSYIITIEGNTNVEGSRDGIGVFKRKRNLNKIYAISNYITPYYEKSNIRILGDRVNSNDTLNVELSNPKDTGLYSSNRQHTHNGTSYPSRYGDYHPGGQRLFEYSAAHRFKWTDTTATEYNQKQASQNNSFSSRRDTTSQVQLRQLIGGINSEGLKNYYASAQERVKPAHNHGNRKSYSVVGKSTLGSRSFGCVGVVHIYWYQNI